MSTLRCWDESDELIPDIVWFNTDTLIASAKIGSSTNRVRVGKFCFRATSEKTAEQLRQLLPLALHDKIEVVDD